MPCKHCSPRLAPKTCPILCPATTYFPTRRCLKLATHASRLGLVCGIHRLSLQNGRKLVLSTPEK